MESIQLRQGSQLSQWRLQGQDFSSEDHFLVGSRDGIGRQAEVTFVVAVLEEGESTTLQTTGKQLRLHFSGALSLSSMKLVIQEYDTVDADAIIHFF